MGGLDRIAVAVPGVGGAVFYQHEGDRVAHEVDRLVASLNLTWEWLCIEYVRPPILPVPVCIGLTYAQLADSQSAPRQATEAQSHTLFLQ